MKSPQQSVTPDVLIANDGTVFLVNPLTARAKEWIDENVQPDAQWFGTTLARSDRNVLMTKLAPSDLRAEAEKLIRTGKMPSLSQVLDTIREVKGNPKHDAPSALSLLPH